MIKLIFILLLLYCGAVLGNDKSICGSWDDRRPSFDRKLARVQKSQAKSGCTLTLIGKSCAITAGHCKRHFVEAHFNVPR